MCSLSLWALVNLLGNAIDAMNEDGCLTVETGYTQDLGHALVRIHNTGPSLTAADIKNVFAVGFSQKSKPDHLGLGLPLARRAIEDAGGQLEMRSPAEGGVEVLVMLPLAGLDSHEIRPLKENKA